MTFSKLLLIDVETTGLDPQGDSIIEIAACILTPETFKEEGFFVSRIRAETPITPGAAKVHGLTAQALLHEPPLTEVMRRFALFAPYGATLCGHNIAFDAGFLRAAYAKAGTSYDFDYHLLDIWSIATFVLSNKGVTLDTYSLNSLCAVFGVERGPHHNALQDIQASAAILRHLAEVTRGRDMEALGQLHLL